MRNPRLNRLRRDHEKMLELVERSSIISIERAEGKPPHTYYLHLTCAGVRKVRGDGLPVISKSHQLVVHLHDQYPRRIPTLQMLTPVFHPNIGQSGTICIGDDGDHGYAPSMGLDDLVVRIVRIIRYENYSLQSVLNTPAERWAAANAHLFPLGTKQIVGRAPEITLLDEMQVIEPAPSVRELGIRFLD